MGISDFVDFVQRNGQCFTPLDLLESAEEEPENYSDFLAAGLDEFGSSTAGSTNAILVLIPVEELSDPEELNNWPLDKFKEYPTHNAHYSWDAHDFGTYDPTKTYNISKLLGYYKILVEGEQSWCGESVWQSEKFPGKYIVNFDAEIYKIFVDQEMGIEDGGNAVRWSFYLEIFDNQGIADMLGKKVKTKMDAFMLVCKIPYEAEMDEE